MRTTSKRDDAIFRAYRQRAAARGTTFAQAVEDALRADLQGRPEAAAHEPFETLVFHGDETPALVDVDDNRALQALMDEEASAGGRA